MNGAQAELHDDELIELLVPPRRPRWQIAVALAGVAVVVAGVLVVNRSGAVSPRMKVDVDATTWANHKATATFVVKNEGWTAVTLRGVSDDVDNLSHPRDVGTMPQTIDPGATVGVTVGFDVDCSSSAVNGQINKVGLELKNALGVTVSQTYTAGPDVQGEGWAQDLWQRYCGAYPPSP